MACMDDLSEFGLKLFAVACSHGIDVMLTPLLFWCFWHIALLCAVLFAAFFGHAKLYVFLLHSAQDLRSA